MFAVDKPNACKRSGPYVFPQHWMLPNRNQTNVQRKFTVFNFDRSERCIANILAKVIFRTWTLFFSECGLLFALRLIQSKYYCFVSHFFSLLYWSSHRLLFIHHPSFITQMLLSLAHCSMYNWFVHTLNLIREKMNETKKTKIHQQIDDRILVFSFSLSSGINNFSYCIWWCVWRLRYSESIIIIIIHIFKNTR